MMADIVANSLTLQQIINRYRAERKLNPATNVLYLYVDSEGCRNVFSTSPDNFERWRSGAVGDRYLVRSEEELISILAMLEI